ncbi:MAG: DUF1905 domain-containing protein [Nocardioides sp.]|nr:DUF1905 domain-containing protein [Nocardioides sp.]
MDEDVLELEGELWLADAADAWVFVTLPTDVGDEVRDRAGPPRGFGSVRVEVTVGSTTWRTSVFPDKVRGYVLPVKKAVRRAESLEVGDSTRLRLVVLE